MVGSGEDESAGMPTAGDAGAGGVGAGSVGAATDGVLTLCPYCGAVSAEAKQCPGCRGLYEPLSRQATQNGMGPWFVRDESQPFRPGCSFEVLRAMVVRGRVGPDTVVRGPTTLQFWSLARRTPAVANLLGLCHACGGHATAVEAACRSCGADFRPPTDRQGMGLGPVRWVPGPGGLARGPMQTEGLAASPERASGSSAAVGTVAGPVAAAPSAAAVPATVRAVRATAGVERGRSASPVLLAMLAGAGVIVGLVLGIVGAELIRQSVSGPGQSQGEQRAGPEVGGRGLGGDQTRGEAKLESEPTTLARAAPSDAGADAPEDATGASGGVAGAHEAERTQEDEGAGQQAPAAEAASSDAAVTVTVLRDRAAELVRELRVGGQSDERLAELDGRWAGLWSEVERLWPGGQGVPEDVAALGRAWQLERARAGAQRLPG